MRDFVEKVGYNKNGGSSIRLAKRVINDYELVWQNYKGKSHSKNQGILRTPTSDYLNNVVKINSYRLKIRLLEEGYFDYYCQRCKNTEWIDNPIPLELHHKDGNKNNNSLDNLELLCPNCHVFTDTYKSKNRK